MTDEHRFRPALGLAETCGATCSGDTTMGSRLDGLGEYDVRRPLVPVRDLLGLVKHLATMELGYLGDCVGRPSLVAPLGRGRLGVEGAEDRTTPDEVQAGIVDLYRTAWRHSTTIDRDAALDAPPRCRGGRRPAAHDVRFAARRMVAETAQHAGHADILRETVDGASSAGLDPGAQATFATRPGGRRHIRRRG